MNRSMRREELDGIRSTGANGVASSRNVSPRLSKGPWILSTNMEEGVSIAGRR